MEPVKRTIRQADLTKERNRKEISSQSSENNSIMKQFGVKFNNKINNYSSLWFFNLLDSPTPTTQAASTCSPLSDGDKSWSLLLLLLPLFSISGEGADVIVVVIMGGATKGATLALGAGSAATP